MRHPAERESSDRRPAVDLRLTRAPPLVSSTGDAQPGRRRPQPRQRLDDGGRGLPTRSVHDDDPSRPTSLATPCSCAARTRCCARCRTSSASRRRESACRCCGCVDGRILLTQRIDLPAARRRTAPWLRRALGAPGRGEADELDRRLRAARPSPTNDRRRVLAAGRPRRVSTSATSLAWTVTAGGACCARTRPAVRPAGRVDRPVDGCRGRRGVHRPRVRPVADRAVARRRRWRRTPSASRGRGGSPVTRDGDTCAAREPPSGGGTAHRPRCCSYLERAGGARPGRRRQSARSRGRSRDIRVRDTVLWETRATRPTTRSRRRLDARSRPAARRTRRAGGPRRDLLRRGGLAARRRVRALDAGRSRAAPTTPTTRSAVLVASSLRGGLPPAAWRDAMAGLTRDECRHGRRARSARADRPRPTCCGRPEARYISRRSRVPATAPASWTATLHRGGVLRMKTWPVDGQARVLHRARPRR